MNALVIWVTTLLRRARSIHPAILAGWASRDAAALGAAGAGPTRRSQQSHQPPWKTCLYSSSGAPRGDFSLPDSIDPFLAPGSSTQASVFAAVEGTAAAGDVDEIVWWPCSRSAAMGPGDGWPQRTDAALCYPTSSTGS